MLRLYIRRMYINLLLYGIAEEAMFRISKENIGANLVHN
jgi:hypothetical protein